MNQEKLDEYKKRLEEERARLLAEIKEEEPRDDFGSDVDMDEEADEAESLGEKIAIGQDHRERISDIDAALAKIENGKYGACEKCGGEIAENILNASPASRLCGNCKKIS